jgi:hypothetical protein
MQIRKNVKRTMRSVLARFQAEGDKYSHEVNSILGDMSKGFIIKKVKRERREYSEQDDY